MQENSQQDVTNTQNENNRQTQTKDAFQSENKNDGVQLSSRYEQYRFAKQHLRGTPRPEVFPFGDNDRTTPDVQGHVANTLTARYHGAEATGTYVEESEQYAQIQQLNSPTHSNDRVYGADGISPTLNTMQGGMRQPFVAIPEATKKGYAEAHVGQSINLAVPNSKTRRGRVSDVAQTLDTGMQQHTLTSDMKIRRLTPVECARLQGFPDNWHKVEGISDTQAYKCYGNAVTTNVVRDIMERLLVK